MLKKFFIIYYKFFKNEGNKETTHTLAAIQAASILTLFFVFWISMSIVLIDKFFHVKIHSIKGLKNYYIIGFVLILLIIVTYFTKNRTRNIEDEFSSLSPEKQNIWGVMLGMLTVIPILAIVVLLT